MAAQKKDIKPKRQFQVVLGVEKEDLTFDRQRRR